VATVQEFFSMAQTKRIKEFVIHSTVSRSFPHFELLPPRQAADDEIAGFSFGTLRFGTQLPTEDPEGVSTRIISHKYEAKQARHTRFGQGFRLSKDVLKTARGQTLMQHYLTAVGANSATLAQQVITSAILRSKDIYRAYRREFLSPGAFAEDAMARRVLDSVGYLHRQTDAIYELINFARDAGRRQGATPFTHALCTSTLFGLLAYGNTKEGEYFRKGPAAPQITEQGGDYFRTHGVHGIKFVEEPEYNLVRAGDQGFNKTNALKRTIEVGRYNLLVCETMVSKDENVTFKESADLGYLNLDCGDGTIQRQNYLDILDACAAFDHNTGELSKCYAKLINDDGAELKKIATDLGAEPPNKSRGARVDPFINWNPGSSPKVVRFLGEQDLYYTTKDDQDMIVGKAIDSLRKNVTLEDLSAVKVMLRKAAEWYCPDDIPYTEAFLYATYCTNVLDGNSNFTELTKLPFSYTTSQNAVANGPSGITYLSIARRDPKYVVCQNISSPGLLSLHTKAGVGLVHKPYSLIEQEVDYIARIGGSGITLRTPGRTAAILAEMRSLVPDFTVVNNLEPIIRQRDTGRTNVHPANRYSELETSDIVDLFGIRIKKDILPGFSRYENMEVLMCEEAKAFLSPGLQETIRKGIDALECIMGFLGTTFSSPNAVNYFFDPKVTDPNVRINTNARSKCGVRSAGNKMLFGMRFESEFQIQNDTSNAQTEIGFCPGITRQFHEENLGLNTVMEHLTGQIKMRSLLTDRATDARLSEFYGQTLRIVTKTTPNHEEAVSCYFPHSTASGDEAENESEDENLGDDDDDDGDSGGGGNGPVDGSVKSKMIFSSNVDDNDPHGEYKPAKKSTGLDPEPFGKAISGMGDNPSGTTEPFDSDFITENSSSTLFTSGSKTGYTPSSGSGTSFVPSSGSGSMPTISFANTRTIDMYHLSLVAYYATNGATTRIGDSELGAKANLPSITTDSGTVIGSTSNDFIIKDNRTTVDIIPTLPTLPGDTKKTRFGVSLSKKYFENLNTRVRTILRSEDAIAEIPQSYGQNFLAGESFSHMRPTYEHTYAPPFVIHTRLEVSNLALLKIMSIENKPFYKKIPENTDVVEYQKTIGKFMEEQKFTDRGGKRKRGGEGHHYNGGGVGSRLMGNMGDGTDMDFERVNSRNNDFTLDIPTDISDATFSGTGLNHGGSVTPPDFTNPWWFMRMTTNATTETGMAMIERCVNMAYCGTRVHKESFGQMYKNNVPPPIGFLLADPFIRIETSPLVLISPSQETGFLSYALPDFSEGKDEDRKMVNFSLTFHMGAIVMRPENILIMPDCVFEGYYGGGDGKLIKTGAGDREDGGESISFLNQRKLTEDYNFRTRDRKGSRFCFPVGFSRKICETPTYISLASTLMDPVFGMAQWIPKELASKPIHASFDSAFLALERFKFHEAAKRHTKPADSIPYADDRNSYAKGNTMVALGDQWVYCKSTGQYSTKYVTGQGPLGSIPPGGTKALRGHSETFEKIAAKSQGSLALAY
jgi:hypothetical protein